MRHATASAHPSRESTPRPSHANGLESRRSGSIRRQQTPERGSLPSRGNIFDHDSAGKPPGRRIRSRSPDLSARLHLDRDRDYPEPRRQRDVSLHYSDGGRSSRGELIHCPSEDGYYHETPSGIALTRAHDNEHFDENQGASANPSGPTESPSPEPGHVVPHDTGLPDPEFKKEKNEYSICCLCWTNNRSCDHQWPCRECKAKGVACAYILCPMSKCPLDVKCPAYHIVPGLDEKRDVGSPMHLLALLGLNRRVVDSYDVHKIQEKIEEPNSAQQIYLLLQKEIEQMTQSGKKKFEDPAARKLLKDSDKVSAMRDKTLRFKASMIAVLVRQLKYAFPVIFLIHH